MGIGLRRHRQGDCPQAHHTSGAVILPAVRAGAFPHAKRPDRLRSLNSLGMVAGSIVDVAWLAIGVLRHQLLPMVRVDALVPAR
jgi:hypothetical protein